MVDKVGTWNFIGICTLDFGISLVFVFWNLEFNVLGVECLIIIHMVNKGGNGSGKSCNLFCGESVNYPVSFDLKVIIKTSIDADESQKNLESLLKKLKVPFSDWRRRPSSGGKYISFTVSVDIESAELLEKVYKDIKEVPGVKFAI
jgi:putative lipoic acid-binding regulatory protein